MSEYFSPFLHLYTRMGMDTDTLHRLIGKRIQTLRAKNGLSQLELATEVDLSKTHLGRLERAESNVSIDSLNKIANYFDIHITYFFKDE